MSKFIDMTGWVMSEHGVPDSKLVVISRMKNDKYGCTRWLCKCTCEEQNEIITSGKTIRNGEVKSCGCLRKESAKENIKIAQPIAAKVVTIANKKYNIVELDLKDESGLYGIGYCSNTNSKFYFDMADYDKIKDYCWCEHIDNKGYHSLEAWDTHNKLHVRMSWVICGKHFDHIDRNPLNNRRSNLRPAEFIQNTQNRNKRKDNTSGIVGVNWHKSSMCWIARISVNKHRVELGSFECFSDAVIARLKAEKEYFGEFAPQKHLFEKYGII